MIIIRGGVIWLAIGWRLAQELQKNGNKPSGGVILVERDKIGQGASHAAAGMLAAGIETEPSEEGLLPLTRAAQNMWPQFAAELEAASGIALNYRSEGSLVIALTRDEREWLNRLARYQGKCGVELEFISPSAARQREPALSPNITAAIYSRHDHQVENRALSQALAVVFRRIGGVIYENSQAELICRQGRAVGVKITHKPDQVQVGEPHADKCLSREILAERIILAAGAWSHDLPGLPDAARPPVRPIKGQMLAVQMDATAPLLSHVVWTHNTYLVPRLDGRLLIGATVEEKGFDAHLTAGGIYSLLEAAWRALPSIEELPMVETWVGHRPGSPDDAPILGEVTAGLGADGLILATGHHRNGILLTPITAELVANYVLHQEASDLWRKFAPQRFDKAYRT
ncbi:MAG: glycine oxidase ThiO [Alphaproteobacteria bacterium]|nr:glycine oxidase ThiO [Alphaproteobacteria bacterium]